MNFSRFFLTRFFFFDDQKLQNLDMFSQKILRTTLKKFLGNRSKRFANTTQKFRDKRNFRKLEKKFLNSYEFRELGKLISAKKSYVTSFF